MRLFIAIETTEEIKEYLREIQDKLRIDAIRATYPKEYHLTLLFLGEVPESKLGEIKENLERIKFSQLRLTLDQLGVFPNENYVKVIWVGIKENEIVESLARQIEKALDKEQNDRFHSHLTLARVKQIYDKKILKELIKEIKIENKQFKVNSFKLIKSTLQKDGSVYEILAEFKAES